MLDRQRADGMWFEPEYTGSGFPLVFYLKYHYYSVYFPLMALSLYASKLHLPELEIDEDSAILPMHRVRVFSPETGYYNNSRPDDPPPSKYERKESSVEQSPRRKSGEKAVTLKLFLG